MPETRKPEAESKTESGRPVAESGPIIETETTVTYLGVKLEKAKVTDSQFVPKREKFADFVYDSEFTLPTMRDIAVCLASGDPILMEGGTSLGKTKMTRLMAAQLGYEVHYANLNNATDIEDLMGRYIYNPNRGKRLGDPEVIFVDGKVTSALRQEEGKVKVLILDEINGASAGILLRLHEILDRLSEGDNVVLSEDASQSVATDKTKTKIVALMNPPGKGYFGREPLDPALLRRFVYKKLPGELPAETLSNFVDAHFGLAARIPEVPQKEFLVSKDFPLLREQLAEVPGWAEITAKYKEFHKYAKALLKARKIAEDVAQVFSYDDHEEPKRVVDFVCRFYNGDINQTMQRALEYYYVGKVESDVDKNMLREQIRMVEYAPNPQESKRKGLQREEKGEKKEPLGVLEDISFVGRLKKGGQIEYSSSAPNRKIIILTDLPPFPEMNKLYDVRILEDTWPRDPMKGKFLGEIIGESGTEIKPENPSAGPEAGPEQSRKAAEQAEKSLMDDPNVPEFVKQKLREG